MLDKKKITTSQFTFLMIANLTFTSTMILPPLAIALGGKDVFLTLYFIAIPHGIAVLLISYALGIRFPGETLPQYCTKIAGPLIGRILGFIYTFTFLWALSGITLQTEDIMETIIMPRTPTIVITASIVIAASYAARGGLNTITRANMLVYPVLLVFTLIIIILSISDIDIKNLFPLMENGISPILKAAPLLLTWTSTLGIVLILFPRLEQPLKVRKVCLFSLIFFCIFVTIILFTTIGVFGEDLGGNMIYSFFGLSRYIKIFLIDVRIEVLSMVILIMSSITFIAFYIYYFALSLAQFFNLKDFKFLILPTALITVIWTPLIGKNNIEIGTEFIPINTIMFNLGFFIIPLILLLTAIIRKKGKKERQNT